MGKTRYVAFVRGLNVGGHGVIRMAELTQAFTQAGAEVARAFLTSGNVLFDTPAQRVAPLLARVQAGLESERKIRTRVIWRKLADLAALVESDPFGAFGFASASKPQVMFLAQAPARSPELPLASKHGDIELLALRGADLLLVAHPQLRPAGDIDALVRKAFGEPGTARTFAMLKRLLVWADRSGAAAR
jgi:uncharacterized protein (DUF1697 family)